MFRFFATEYIYLFWRNNDMEIFSPVNYAQYDIIIQHGDRIVTIDNGDVTAPYVILTCLRTA